VTKKIFGRWANYREMQESWVKGYYDYEANDYKRNPLPDNFPSEDSVLFASYGGVYYEGDAIVIYRQDDALYEVHGSHCSCYGLEDQWKPEETTVAALAMRERQTGKTEYFFFLRDHEGEAQEAYWSLVDSMTAEIQRRDALHQ
jgi:hypothetical protein